MIFSLAYIYLRLFQKLKFEYVKRKDYDFQILMTKINVYILYNVYLVYYILSILTGFSNAACLFRMNGTMIQRDEPNTRMMPSILKIGP